MPGSLMHMAFAEIVYEGLKELKIDKTEFLIGNILPDEAGDKTMSHYRVPCSVDSYKLPDMVKVKNELFDLKDPIKLGCYCHLYFDYHFFEDYAFDLFRWDKKENTVTNKRNGLSWQTEEFWSPRVFYSAYGEFNHLILKDGYVNLEEVFKMPRILPFVGNVRFDNRRKVIWIDELNYFIEHELTYTGNVLEYEPSMAVLKKIANNLIREIQAAR